MAGINLKVQIEINGQFVQAGHITGSSFRDAVFSYDESYITSSAAHAISLSLPLSKKDFDTDATKSFFDGLLPEGLPVSVLQTVFTLLLMIIFLFSGNLGANVLGLSKL